MKLMKPSNTRPLSEAEFQRWFEEMNPSGGNTTLEHLAKIMAAAWEHQKALREMASLSRVEKLHNACNNVLKLVMVHVHVAENRDDNITMKESGKWEACGLAGSIQMGTWEQLTIV